MESELAYSSFSAKEEEHASAAIFLLLSTSSISLNNYHSYRQIKINLVLQNNIMSFYSISTSAAQRLSVSFAMSVLTAPAEIRAMVKVLLVSVCGSKIF